MRTQQDKFVKKKFGKSFKQAVELRAASLYLENITNQVFGETSLEKSLGTSKAPQRRAVKMTGRIFSGHTGQGTRPTRMTRLSSVPTVSTPSNSSSPSVFSNVQEKPPSLSSLENWMDHEHMKVGSIVKIQHPYKHTSPIMARILSIGSDGVLTLDSKGDTHKIRWEHIFELHPVVDSDEKSEDYREAMIELSRLGMPQDEITPLNSHDLREATEHLRSIGIPLEEDIVNYDAQSKHGDIYQDLLNSGVPVDPIELIESSENSKNIPEHLHGILAHIKSLGANIDEKLIADLPYDQILKVLQYYIEKSKEAKK